VSRLRIERLSVLIVGLSRSSSRFLPYIAAQRRRNESRDARLPFPENTAVSALGIRLDIAARTEPHHSMPDGGFLTGIVAYSAGFV